MGENLNEWIKRMLQEKGWSMRELSKRSGLSSSYVSNVVMGKRQPGIKFYQGISRAFGVSMDSIERLDREGIEPGQVDDLDDDLTLSEAIRIMEKLTPEGRKELLKYALLLTSRYLRGLEPGDEAETGEAE